MRVKRLKDILKDLPDNAEILLSVNGGATDIADREERIKTNAVK